MVSICVPEGNFVRSSCPVGLGSVVEGSRRFGSRVLSGWFKSVIWFESVPLRGDVAGSASWRILKLLGVSAPGGSALEGWLGVVLCCGMGNVARNNANWWLISSSCARTIHSCLRVASSGALVSLVSLWLCGLFGWWSVASGCVGCRRSCGWRSVFGEWLPLSCFSVFWASLPRSALLRSSLSRSDLVHSALSWSVITRASLARSAMVDVSLLGW